MHLFVYISDYEGRASELDSVLAEIAATSKVRNRKWQVTGVLFHQNGSFLEVLEGSKETLRALMKRIAADKRHRHLTCLIDQPIEERRFDDWNIDSLNLADHVQLNREKLRELSEDFCANPAFKTDLLVQFYKNMIWNQ